MGIVQEQHWEIVNMPGPMAMPVPDGGVAAGEKYEIQMSRGSEKAVAQLVVPFDARICLDNEIKKLNEDLQFAAKLTIYPRAIRAYISKKLAMGWSPVSQPDLTFDSKSMQGILDQFKTDGVF
jgi:hypothetical protein